MSAREPELSVVVCSHNGEHRLPTTLAQLEHQSLVRSRYEVIVVDDGSTDRTGDVARSLGAKVVTLSPSRGLAAARNAGVQAAAGSILAFTDDDCEPDRHWLAVALAALSDPSVDGVGGAVLPSCASGFLLRYLQANNPLTPLGAELLSSNDPRYRLRLYLRGVARSTPDPPAGAQLYSVVGANMTLRRELIVELGGFDDAFAFGVEEEDLCLRAHARPQGAQLRYAPAAVVLHRFRPRLRDGFRRAYAYGRGHARAAIKHSDLRLIVYPFPALTASAFLFAGLRRRKASLAPAMFAPMIAYARWPRLASRTGSLEPLAYPYLQLAEEAATMLGELHGLGDGYERRRSCDWRSGTARPP